MAPAQLTHPRAHTTEVSVQQTQGSILIVWVDRRFVNNRLKKKIGKTLS